MEEYVAPVFKLSDLAQLYKQHLEQLGAATTGHVNTSRLKERLLSVFPDLGTSSKSGSERNPSSNTVPRSLLALINMILEGPNIKHQSELVTAATLTIGQLCWK